MKRMLPPYEKVDPEDVGIEPPRQVPCPQCNGELVAMGPNKDKSRFFLECRGECKFCFVVPVEQLHNDW